MKNLFSALTSSRKEDKHVKSRRLRLESLETRQMLDAAGLMDAAVAAQELEVQEASYSSVIPVTIAEDILNHDDDFYWDGSPHNISLRDAFDYVVDGYYDIISLESSNSVHVLDTSLGVTASWNRKVKIIGNNHTITTNGKCEAILLRNLIAAEFDNVRFYNCGSASLWGAVRYSGSEPLVVNGCQFTNCAGFDGGAIYSSSDLTVNNTTFNNCSTVGFGGAICSSSDLTVNNTTFNNCSADSYGGAIYGGRVSLTGSTFTGNNATRGGAVYLDQGASVFDNCTFAKNGTSESALYGGAVYVATYANPSFTGCTFTENGFRRVSTEVHEGDIVAINTDFSVRGGAIYRNGIVGDITLTDTTFTGNCGYYGGAIYSKGGVNINGDVEFNKNEAYLGGAIYASSEGRISAMEGSGNKFNSNIAHFSDRATQAHGSGGAIYLSSKGPIQTLSYLYNVSFTGNQAYKYGGAIANYATVNSQYCDFTGNVAAIGGAVCNASDFTSTGDTFTENGAYCGGDQESLEGYDWLYTAGGNGGAIYSANNATTGVGATLSLYDSAVFEGNSASRSGGAINVVSGNLVFAYDEDGSYVFDGNLSMCGMGGAIVLANGLENVDFQNNDDVDPADVFLFNFNYAWYAPTIGVTGKDGAQMRRVVENFGFDYSNLSPDQVDTFTHYDDQLTDGRLTYDYLAELCNWLSPNGTITVCYIGDGSTGEVTIGPDEEVQLSELGIPTTAAGVIPGSYKLEFYYGNPDSDPKLNPESKTAFELIVGVNEADDVMMMRRIEILGYDDFDLVPMTAFSFVTYNRPVEAVIIDWGDGSDWWVSQVESFSTNVYHIFPDKIEWDPKSGEPNPNVYTVSADFALVGQTRHITVTFQYQAHASSKDWHVRPGETGSYDPYAALLDSAFAELDLFDI